MIRLFLNEKRLLSICCSKTKKTKVFLKMIRHLEINND
jgi:hypothetical protein